MRRYPEIVRATEAYHREQQRKLGLPENCPLGTGPLPTGIVYN